MWGSEPSQQRGNFFGIIVLFSSLWIIHLAGMGFDFIRIVVFLLSNGGFFFVFGRGVSFISVFQEISPGCSLEGLILKLELQYFGHLMRRADSLEKTLMLGKTEGRRRRGR